MKKERKIRMRFMIIRSKFPHIPSQSQLKQKVSKNIPSTPRGYLTPPPPRPLQPYPRSCTVVILNLSRDRRKMAINLKKNGDSLRKTWQQVFDDSSDVNWWVFHPNFHPNQTIWWHSFSFQGRVWVWWQDKRSESGRNRRYVVRKFRCIWHDIS